MPLNDEQTKREVEANDPPIEPGQSPREPTKAQRELLVWMREHELDDTKKAKERETTLRQAGLTKREAQWRASSIRTAARYFAGGSLINYYKNKSDKHHGGYADHGWRRAGGTALKRLADAGFATIVGYEAGVVYSLTDVGRDWADHFLALKSLP